jgi:hypothetical protein
MKVFRFEKQGEHIGQYEVKAGRYLGNGFGTYAGRQCCRHDS